MTVNAKLRVDGPALEVQQLQSLFAMKLVEMGRV